MEQKTTTTTRIEQYEEIADRLETLETGYEVRVRDACKDIQDDLDELTASIETAKDELKSLRESISEDVLSVQDTLRGENWMFVYNKPAIRWRTADLPGYALAHPEILELRYEGEPRMSVRRITK